MMTFISLGIVTSVLLFIFSMGLRADIKNALFIIHEPKQMIRSLFSMLILMPVLCLFLFRSFDVPLTVKVVLVAASLAPVPPLLSKKILKNGGTRDYAFGLMLAAMIFSLFFASGIMTAISSYVHMDATISFLGVANIIFFRALLPFFAGVAFQKIWPELTAKIVNQVERVATILLVLFTIPVLLAKWPSVRELIFSKTILVLFLFSALGLLLGHVIGGPTKGDKTVLALATSSRHPGVTLVLAQMAYPAGNDFLAVVILLFLVNLFLTGLYLNWREHHDKVALKAKRYRSNAISSQRS